MKEIYEGIRIISPPISCIGREVYPVVKFFACPIEHGGFISGDPIGLIINESDNWFFVSIHENYLDITELLDLIKTSKKNSG